MKAKKFKRMEREKESLLTRLNRKRIQAFTKVAEKYDEKIRKLQEKCKHSNTQIMLDNDGEYFSCTQCGKRLNGITKDYKRGTK